MSRTSTYGGAVLLGLTLVSVGNLDLFAQAEGSCSEVPAYRIATELQPNPQDTVIQMFSADVVVEDWVTREEVESLLCRVLEDRLPSHYNRVVVHVWWRRVFFDTTGIDHREAMDHIIASYIWSWHKPKGGSLTLFHDKAGNRIEGALPRTQFNHMEACGLAPPSKPEAGPGNH